ncbi:MAG: tetratricopeptide repeat protein [Deltaproteobacteria bacterium]|nr:tetratricopeptide repeat protein [Deltaproteobacteria bacterium]
MMQQNLATWGWQRPTLIVIDYAASRARQLHDWFAELAENGGDPQKPLRVLLLERHADPAGGWWQEAFGRGDGDAQAVRHLLDPADRPVALPSLADPEERRALLTAVLAKLGSTERPPARGTDAHFDRLLADLSWGGEPLFLFMAGLTAARLGFGQVLALSRVDLAYAIADRESERIETFAKKHKLNPRFLSHMAAYVTLCQGLERSAVEEASEEEKTALKRPSAGDPPDIVEALFAVLSSEGEVVQPIQPDMIGEAVLLRVLQAHSQEQQDACILRAFGHAGGRVAATVMRTAQDYAFEGDPAPLAWLDGLAREGTVNFSMLVEIANQLPLNTLVLRERAAAIYDTIVAQARHYVAAAPDTEAPRSLLASSLNNLANCLSDLGQREEALAAAREAVALYRQLAAARPDAFVPDLAMSLNNLANCLSDLGQREEALAAAREAVELLSPFFLALPPAFAQGMLTMVRDYLKYTEQLQREPNAALLIPILEKLNALQSPTGGES